MRHRLMKTSIAAVALILVVVLIGFSIFIYNYYYSAATSSLQSKAKTATGFFRSYVTNTYAEFYDSAYKYSESFSEADKLELQFIDTSGRILISTNIMTAGGSPGTPDIENALKRGVSDVFVGKSRSNEKIISVSAPILNSSGRVAGVMRYITATKNIDREILTNELVALGIAVLIMLIVFAVNLLFVRSFIEPVSEITAIAGRIAAGSYGIQIEKSYEDEAGQMVEAINEMSEKIGQAEKMQTEFISSVSHELRTPLTAITGWSETLLYNDALDSETTRGLSIILKEARRLTKMVEELLEFTRMEDNRFTLNVEQVDIVSELEDTIFAYNELLKQENMSVNYIPPEQDIPVIPADPSRMRQVFLNILDNSRKYANGTDKIDVSVNMDSEYVIVTIRDYGSGVPEADIDNIKKKFFKGKNAKERGSGIGLAVCDEIISYHGGKFIIKNAEGGGLESQIYLPLTSTVLN